MSELDICNLAVSKLGDITLNSISAPSSKAERLCNTWYPQVRDELLEEFPWTFARGRFTTSSDLQPYVAVSAIASTADAVTGIETLEITTATAHDFVVSDSVTFTDLGGATELNGNDFRVDTITPNLKFTLSGVDGADVTAFTSGGNVRRSPLFDFKYSYALPSDFLQDITTENNFIYEIRDGVIYTDETSFNFQYTRKEEDTTRYSKLFTKALASKLAAEICWSLVQSTTVLDAMVTLADRDLAKAKKKDGFRGNTGTRETWLSRRNG